MVKITGRYLGNKKVELVHGPSGLRLTTAAPVDNQGDGSSFSPTDLLAGATAACMMTILGIVAERDGIDLTGMTVELEKEMAAAPRRVARVPITLHLPGTIKEAQRTRLEEAARACPVAQSLHPAVDVKVEFIYDL